MEQEDSKLTPLKKFPKLQLHIEQLLLKLTRGLEEWLFYNKYCGGWGTVHTEAGRKRQKRFSQDPHP